jgi:hypothetical protein
MVDTFEGVRQLTPWGKSREEYDQVQARDAALMDSGSGMAGNVVGQLVTALAPGGVIGAAGKAAAIPRMVAAGRALNMPQTVLGALGVGAGQGAVQPVGTDDSRLRNMALAAGGGAAIPAVTGAVRTGVNLVAPFTQGGVDRIAGRAIQRFTTEPSVLRNVQPTQYVPGSLPTLADVTADPGLATLQQSLRNNPEIKGAYVQRELGNNAARVEALRAIAGDAGKRDFYAASRNAAAKDLYDKAFAEAPDLTPWVKGRITHLRSRPVFNEALAAAEKRAANEGVKLDPTNIVQVLHYAKMELDDLASTAKAGGRTGLSGILDTKKQLVSLMESKDFAPAYREARATYAEMSKPINQMDVGQELLDKLRPALAESGANLRENKSAFAQAMRNADATAAKATDFPGATMESVMTPEQMAAIQGVLKDIGRAANTQDMGKAIGSPTTQNFLAQDVLRQSLGPLGIPKSFLESQLANNSMRPMSWIYKNPENNALRTMANATLNPDEWQRLLAILDKNPSLLQKFMSRALPASVVPAALGTVEVGQ